MDKAKEWADYFRTRVRITADPANWSKADYKDIADAIDQLLAERDRLLQTIETMKANERERWASATKAFGIPAPCDRIKDKGEG